jgi:hypothetical protein
VDGTRGRSQVWRQVQGCERPSMATTRSRSWLRVQAEAAERTERRHDVTVRTRWANLEGVYWGDEGFAFKHAA